jgi:hypothetical protein
MTSHISRNLFENRNEEELARVAAIEFRSWLKLQIAAAYVREG